MDAGTLSIKSIFGKDIRDSVPPFQRPDGTNSEIPA